MNALNRLLMFVILLILFLCLLGSAVFPFGALGFAQTGLSNLNESLTQVYLDSGSRFRIGQILLVLVSALVFIPLIWLEVRRRGPVEVVVQTDSGGQASLTASAVTQRLAWHLDQLGDVISATPLVSPHGNSVDVKLNVRTTPDIEVPMKTEEIIEMTREVVEERMGLHLGKIEVHLDHAPYLQNEQVG